VIDSGAIPTSGGSAVAGQPGVTYWYSYDADDQMQTEEMAPGDLTQSSSYVPTSSKNFTPLSSFSYTYDADGNLLQLDDAMGNRTKYTYNALDELTVAQQGTVSGGVYNMVCTAGFTYDGDGNLQTITRNIAGVSTPDVVSTYTYNAAGDLTALDHTHAQSSSDIIQLANYAWTFDAAGNVTAQTLTTSSGLTMTAGGFLPAGATDQTSLYSYDPANQLLSDSLDGDSYTYDANGNRNSAGTSGGASVSQAVTANELTSDGTYNYTYDANGNCVTRTQISSASSNQFITLYTWDYRNRLVEVQYENNSGQLTETLNYSYDYLDRRIEKITTSTGGATDYNYLAYQGAHPYAQFDSGAAAIGSGSPSAALTDLFMQAPTIDQVLSDYQNDAGWRTFWLLPDDQGTIRDIAGYANFGTASAFVWTHRNYDAYGNITSVTSYVSNIFSGTFIPPNDPNTILGYQQGIYDSDLNMVQFAARWYVPSTGSWLSPDPSGLTAGSNPYGYCNDDPLGETDPTGRCGYPGTGIVSVPGSGPLNLAADTGTIFPGTVSSPGLTSIITGEPLPSVIGGGISPSTAQDTHLAAIAQSEAFSEDTGGDMVAVPGAAPLTINIPSYPAPAGTTIGPTTTAQGNLAAILQSGAMSEFIGDGMVGVPGPYSVTPQDQAASDFNTAMDQVHLYPAIYAPAAPGQLVDTGIRYCKAESWLPCGHTYIQLPDGTTASFEPVSQSWVSNLSSVVATHGVVVREGAQDGDELYPVLVDPRVIDPALYQQAVAAWVKNELANCGPGSSSALYYNSYSNNCIVWANQAIGKDMGQYYGPNLSHVCTSTATWWDRLVGRSMSIVIVPSTSPSSPR
jgi:RHS repeat-associated protein